VLTVLLLLSQVPLLLNPRRLPLLLLIARALLAAMESTTPHVSRALPTLPRSLIKPALPKLIAIAMLTFMEMLVHQSMPAVLMHLTALLVLTVVKLLLNPRRLPLPLLIARALPTPMEPTQCQQALVPHALPTLPLLVECSTLPKLLAIAVQTITEMPKRAQNAVLAPPIVKLLSNHQLVRLPWLIANAQSTLT